jgi:hypothetical protein
MGEGYHPGYPSRVLCAVGPLLAFLLFPDTPPAATSVEARLAEEMASELLRVARGRALEVAPSPEAALPAGAAEWRALLLARLEGRIPLAADGPRLRVQWALLEAPARVVASARLLEEPGGRLLDIVSVSVPRDEAILPLSPQPLPAPRTTVDVVATSRSAPMEGLVLALAWLSEQRVLAVFPDEAALYRLEASSWVLESRRQLPRPLSTVRSPGALVVAEGGAAWALTSAAASAVLLGVEDGRLRLRSRAEALPWPGNPTGLRFRPGTNLIDGQGGALGPGPFLALEASGAAAVDGDGELRLAGPEGGTRAGIRVGSAVARLWSGMLAVSSPAAPAHDDAVSLVEASDRGAGVVETIPLEGTIRALASRPSAEGVRLLVAVEEAGARTRLVLMDLRRPGP